MYAAYRVVVALYLFVHSIYVIHVDFLVDVRDDVVVPVAHRLMHYGYWTFFVLTIDFGLQVPGDPTKHPPDRRRRRRFRIGTRQRN